MENPLVVRHHHPFLSLMMMYPHIVVEFDVVAVIVVDNVVLTQLKHC